MVLYIVDAKVPERARLDIFERVNGGVPLDAPADAKLPLHGAATRFWERKRPPICSRGRPEALLGQRPCVIGSSSTASVHSGSWRPDEYKGEMDEFLARPLTYMNTLTSEQLDSLSNEFRNSLRNNLQVFGEHAFRRACPEKVRRSDKRFSLDVMSTGLARFPESQVQARADTRAPDFTHCSRTRRSIDPSVMSPSVQIRSGTASALCGQRLRRFRCL